MMAGPGKASSYGVGGSFDTPFLFARFLVGLLLLLPVTMHGGGTATAQHMQGRQQPDGKGQCGASNNKKKKN